MPATLVTLQCPACTRTIPAASVACQFCGTAITQANRPPGVFAGRRKDTRSWQEIAYYILAVIWLLQGGYEIAQAAGVFPSAFTMIGGGGFIGIIGGANLFIGIGLLTEASWAQFVVKVLCWIQLPFAVIGYLYVFVSKHPLLLFCTQSFTVGLLILQLYVIHEYGDA